MGIGIPTPGSPGAVITEPSSQPFDDVVFRSASLPRASSRPLSFLAQRQPWDLILDPS